MERRKHARVNLKQPIACVCHLEDGEVLHGHVKNVGTMGVMIEVPDLEDRLIMDCCQHVHLEEVDVDDKHMFSGMTGMMNWTYKNYIGIGFDLPIRPTHEELLDWLKSFNQLGEEVI